MASQHGLPVLLFACMDAQTLAAACEISTRHNDRDSDQGGQGTAFRAALIPGTPGGFREGSGDQAAKVIGGLR